MFGLRDEFEYLECSNCGCLQLETIPQNLAAYYPDNYYSYASKGEDEIIQNSLSKKLKRGFKKGMLDFYLRGDKSLGKLISGKLKGYYPWIKENMVRSTSAILDVGCGSGELLLRMYNDGFKNLTGVDPFIKADIHYKCGVTIYKKQLNELTDKYDLIMLHHAFEHMDNPLDVLKNIHQLLNPKGIALIRIPIADSFAWKKYGVNWVQLDAPRHFFLHTNKSMKLLSDQSGFELRDVFYDSWALQFYGSEQYLKGIPLRSEETVFTQEEMDNFSREAEKLNQRKEGDAACFYLYKK